MGIKDIIDKLLGRKKGPLITIPELLSGLPEGYEFFSSILYDRNEIDHVVFSRRQGLFLIREQIGVDVFITPVVVFEKAKVKVTQPIIGVNVAEISGLTDIILNAPERNVLEDGVLMVLRELHGIQTIKYRSM